MAERELRRRRDQGSERILPISLIAGTAIVALVYVTINFAYLKALGLGGLAATTTPASDAARLLFGAAGDRFVTAAIAISTFGFLNLCVLAPTRVYYAMAADGAFFPQVARLHPRFQTPSLAIVLQSTWAIALTLTGTYGQLLDYVVFADWIFFGLTVARCSCSGGRCRIAAAVPHVGISVDARVVRRRRDRHRHQRDSRQPGAIRDRRRLDGRRRARVLLLEEKVVTTPSAPYMRWAKTRPHVTYDLASSGLNPVTTAELLGDVAARDAFEISGSNDEGLVPLREAIAARYGVTADCVSIAGGASGANFQALLALLQPGDDVLIEEPGYDPLIGAARAAGANVVRFERSWKKGFALDPYVIRTALTPATKLIVISNAHNPSGSMASRDVIEQIGIMADAIGALVLVDEVYAEAQHDDAPVPMPAARFSPAFVTTNSLTKAYGLAGLRCGWIVASPALSSRIRETRDIIDGSGSFVAEHLALTAFQNIDRLRARARAILSRNLDLVRAMRRHIRGSSGSSRRRARPPSRKCETSTTQRPSLIA